MKLVVIWKVVPHLSCNKYSITDFKHALLQNEFHSLNLILRWKLCGKKIIYQFLIGMIRTPQIGYQVMICSSLYGKLLLSLFVNTVNIHQRWAFLSVLFKGKHKHKIQGFLSLSKGIWKPFRLWVLERFAPLPGSQLPKKRTGHHPTVLVHKKPTWPASTPDCFCLLKKVVW